MNSGDDSSEDHESFKSCSCGHGWPSRDTFLADPATQLIGYQVHFRELRLGLLLFNHLRCKSTIGIPAEDFRDLYDGPVFAERLTGTDDCPEYCLRVDYLERCPSQCECAYVREILQIVRRWPKAGFDDN